MKKLMTILVEDYVYPDRSIFEPGSVEIEDDVLPITFNFNFDSPEKNFLGLASEFVRNPDNSLTMVMDFSNEYVTEEFLESCEARIYATQVIHEVVDNKKVCHSCLLKGIGICLKQKGWEHPNV